MSKTKSYTLLSGKHRQGDKVFKVGDIVELTEAQAKAFADSIQPVDAAAEPVITGTKQMTKLAPKKEVEAAAETEETDTDGEETEDEGEEEVEAQAQAPAPQAKPAAVAKPAAKPIAKPATNKQVSK